VRRGRRPTPDDWQQRALELGLRTHRGKWASFEVGIDVARQNGKGGIIEARDLVGLFCAFGSLFEDHGDLSSRQPSIRRDCSTECPIRCRTA
jgi:hypothetical protein